MNLRSRPIEGVVTDNSGNVLRSATITIKELAPESSNIIDVATSDNDGYFISKSIKNGVYDIYESGIRVERIYHSANPTCIQSYAADSNELPTNIGTFAESITDLNAFIHYIQIESSNIDVDKGNIFPIWNVDPTDLDEASAPQKHPFSKLKDIHTGVDPTSKFTQTRFDVEYNSDSRYIRWVGIPAIKFKERLVLPLDYFSITPSNFYKKFTGGQAWSIDAASNNTIIVIQMASGNVSIGDILKIRFDNDKYFWCIVQTISGTYEITAKLWGSSYGNSLDLTNFIAGTDAIDNIVSFQAMFNNITNIKESVNSAFTVTENLQAQDQYVQYDASGDVTVESELYNYSGA